ncbi:hypothetical protein F5Y16DRAFT_168017 [Xylariaceae sp. FL0255]|nr:hypothetical protein F5Y16DRAFT_168017 [Xylariaceae sp. FL0255]
MSIQKLACSAITASQEANFGLATINVDFSLLKVEAPKEFKALGTNLSQVRRKSAEDGTPHIIARRLGALFRQCLASTPNLVRTYGTRASEIAANPKVNPKPTRAHGVFAEHVGIDGTSIWAAATSGAEAIAVHLLACMLARIWSRSEAVAIWTELILARKKQLQETSEVDPQYQLAIQDSRIEVTHDQLAWWDSSARAWLQAADEAMVVKQTQLMLVLNNLSLPVNTKPKLYDNVMQAWISAMITIENLLSGMPQGVTGGSTLLGLSSWHLYPDMLVLEDATVEVKQNDKLLGSAGILTIGLNVSTENQHGVFWSLPLGHLRYYGNPVVSESSLVTQGNRVTLPQLMLMAVGRITSHWQMDESTIAHFLTDTCKVVGPDSGSDTAKSKNWVAHLADAVKPLLSKDSMDVKIGRQLMKLGARRCSKFIPQNHQMPRLFDLNNLSTFVSLLGHPEDAVQYLRKSVENTSRDVLGNRNALIMYARGTGNAQHYRIQHEFATLFPMQSRSRKRLYDGEVRVVMNSARHKRWICPYMYNTTSDGGVVYDPSRLEQFQKLNEDTHDYTSRDLHVDAENDCVIWDIWQQELEEYGFNVPDQGANKTEYPFVEEDDVSMGILGLQHSSDISLEFDMVAGSLDTIAVLISKIKHDEQKDQCGLGSQSDKDGVNMNRLPNDGESQGHRSINSGDSEALYLRPLLELTTKIPDAIVFEALQAEESGLRRDKVSKHLTRLLERDPSLHVSLRTLLTALMIYDSLPGTTVSLNVISQSLSEMSWVPNEKIPTKPVIGEIIFKPYRVDRSSVFACIASFETGSHVAHPATLRHVMAMAVGDSIFISSNMLCDPQDQSISHEVTRVRGNIGRSGIAMMVPPRNPLMREAELDNWQLVNHEVFDGVLHDSFSSTTLHLGFTDYVLPMDVGSHGSRGFEIYFLESIVSVHDKGEWVADVDIQLAFSNTSWRGHDGSKNQPRLGYVKSCDHVGHAGCSARDVIGSHHLTSVDDWNEILEPPNGVGIVRSLGNWLGRLSATTVCLQKGHSVLVLPDKFCWSCISEKWCELMGIQSRAGMLRREDIATELERMTGAGQLFLVC